MRQSNANAKVEEELLDIASVSQSSSLAEMQSSRLNGLVWTGIATCVCILVCLMVVSEIFYWTSRNEIQKKQLATGNALLKDTRTQEQARLTRYQWVKKGDGVLRIPVERAKELVIADYARPASAASAAVPSETQIAAGGTSP